MPALLWQPDPAAPGWLMVGFVAGWSLQSEEKAMVGMWRRELLLGLFGGEDRDDRALS